MREHGIEEVISYDGGSEVSWVKRFES